MTHHVYYFWRDRTPLYIGVTGNLKRRLRQHAGDHAPWSIQATRIASIPFDDEAGAYAAEAEQIASLRPTYNVRHNPARRSIWDAYDEEPFIPQREIDLANVAVDAWWTRVSAS